MSSEMTPLSSARVLTMNRGSATLKAALYDMGDQGNLVLSIKVDRASSSSSHITIADSKNVSLFESSPHSAKSDRALDTIFRWLDEKGYLHNLAAAGHRLVHGGSQFKDPIQVTPDVLAKLEKLVPLDPDHLSEAIAGIRFILNRQPNLLQIACFDTAFHGDLPAVAKRYALPREFYDSGLKRYGFHGLSYEYIFQKLRTLEPTLAEGSVVIAHLGNGCSMAALRRGQSIDTSMGMTPLEGLVMGTRSGDIDPGALLYLLEQRKMSVAELSTCLNKQSGLLGVSGLSEDMRDLLEQAPQEPHAREAIDLFCYRVKKYLGAYAAALGGIDVLVFAGGIGEHVPAVREQICSELEFLGIQLDKDHNQSNAAVISSRQSRVQVRVIETNEDLMIGRHTLAFLSQIEPKRS